MKHEFRAKRDVELRRGDRVFSNKEGETMEVSATGANIVLQELADDYEYVRAIPDRDIEKERAKEEAEFNEKALMNLPKKKLLEKAGDIEGVTEDNNKKEIVAKIIEAHEK